MCSLQEIRASFQAQRKVQEAGLAVPATGDISTTSSEIAITHSVVNLAKNLKVLFGGINSRETAALLPDQAVLNSALFLDGFKYFLPCGHTLAE